MSAKIWKSRIKALSELLATEIPDADDTKIKCVSELMDERIKQEAVQDPPR